MSKGLTLFERSVLNYDEERLRRDPRPPLHSHRGHRDVRTVSLRADSDHSPEPVKQEQDDLPLELPFNTVIVKNEFDLARFSPLKPKGRGREESDEEDSEEEEEEEEGESAAEEPGCSLGSQAQSQGQACSLLDTDDSDDGEPPAKRTKRDNEPDTATEERILKDVPPPAANRSIYQFIFHNRAPQNVRQEPGKNQERPDAKPKPCSSSSAEASKTDDSSLTIRTETRGDAPGSVTKDSTKTELPQNKTLHKERKRAPATFNGTVDKTKHQCSECHKYFQCEAHLQRHMLIHYGLKPFECPVCDKAFRYKSSYKAHLNMHTEEKPLTCSLCDKGFTQSRDLKRHMLSHTDEKNFDCPECGGKFKHKHNLIRHISVIHKAEKPYPCPMCDKAFAQKHDFMTHMRTHSGEKPFSCNICSRSFGAKGTLRTHMKVHRKRLPKELQPTLSFHDFMSEDKELCN